MSTAIKLGLYLNIIGLMITGSCKETKMKTEFEKIASVKPNVLTAAQFKLTYHGTQSKPVPSVVLVTRGHKLDMDAFEPFQTAELSYGNDNTGGHWVVTVSTDEMHAMIQATNKALHLVEADSHKAWVSCTVVLVKGLDHKGAYLLFDRPQSKQAIAAMVDALEPDNEAGRDALNRWQSMI